MQSLSVQGTFRRALMGVVALTTATTFWPAKPALADDSAAMVSAGLGHYLTQPKAGLLSPESPLPALPRFAGGDLIHAATPTNQWYSSVLYQWPTQPLHAHPMTYRAAPEGFELGLPQRLVVPMHADNNEIRYPHQADVSVRIGTETFTTDKLVHVDDWLATLEMTAGSGATLRATVLHGSPFSYFESSTPDIHLHVRAGSTPLALDAGIHGEVVSFSLDGKTYAAFAPAGSVWHQIAPNDLALHLPAQAKYFSVAGLPDAKAQTLADFTSVAYAFPVSTRVQWQFDASKSVLRATYQVSTEARNGGAHETFLGLYPHHWDARVENDASQYSYDSIRGPIRLVRGNSFTLVRPFHGMVPYWGGLQNAEHDAELRSILRGDAVKARQIFTRPDMGRGTYWTGKGLGALAQLLSVAEAEGNLDVRDTILHQLEERMESWFSGERSTYFAQDARTGTFIGYPQEYNSISDMNDHHFHYGYWVMAAAHVALRDPAWISTNHWGAMVDKLVADIATAEHGRADYPFIRNFDVYEGHSWASGNADFVDGNNQESSSEAVNAWAGLVLLGEATHRPELRDLGIFLYTSEVASVQHYWSDLKHNVLAPEFNKPFASMVFGGKYSYNTWWTQEPHQILGINVLPLTAASTYLGQDPDYVSHCVAALGPEVAAYQARGMSDGTPADIWQDVIASYLALADPEAGYAAWAPKGSVERGETRTHTLHWLMSLREMGPPDFGVMADTPLYSVFRNKQGKRTYLAYNAGDLAIDVHFTDGSTLHVLPHQLTRSP